MTTTNRIARSTFAETYALSGWSIINRSLVADFEAAHFSAAVNFVVNVTTAAEAAKHHPDIEIRYPGKVRISLTTHAANGLTDADANLAYSITDIARVRGVSVKSPDMAQMEVAIDALDIPGVMPFWKAVLAYVEEEPANPGDPVDALLDPLRIGPAIWFQQMAEPRPQRNRIHIDVRLPPERVEARIAEAVAAGGTLINKEHARAFWVLADPEGNEICLCTWQDRD